ncbi:MAG: hypothetical protein JXK07_01700 [Spirochaetes bacterium]|nr:hypothetical protein [Spirochaetota bacterium]MBN2772288.1 hypothetical protein [Spirochaetota bacterium]
MLVLSLVFAILALVIKRNTRYIFACISLIISNLIFLSYVIAAIFHPDFGFIDSYFYIINWGYILNIIFSLPAMEILNTYGAIALKYYFRSQLIIKCGIPITISLIVISKRGSITGG